MAGRVRVMFSHTTDPWFNLATEDWIFRELDPAAAALFLWRNDPTVVIGKHQNPWIECDIRLMEREGVLLARRQSGGGAVYHDPGNTNFTFLAGSDTYSVDAHFDIVLAALASLGIDGERTKRNDIVVDGRKVSGNAFKHVRDRSFHHGTLLVRADLDRLTRYLNPAKRELVSKGIKSVRSRVANLEEFAPGLDHERLCTAVRDAFCAHHRERPAPEILDETTLRAIPTIREYYEKISHWQWRFGLTPDFRQRLTGTLPWGQVRLEISVHLGMIATASVDASGPVLAPRGAGAAVEPSRAAAAPAPGAPFPELTNLMQDTLVGIVYGREGIRTWCAALRRRAPDRRREIDDVQSWLEEAL